MPQQAERRTRRTDRRTDRQTGGAASQVSSHFTSCCRVATRFFNLFSYFLILAHVAFSVLRQRLSYPYQVLARGSTVADNFVLDSKERRMSAETRSAAPLPSHPPQCPRLSAPRCASLGMMLRFPVVSPLFPLSAQSRRLGRWMEVGCWFLLQFQSICSTEIQPGRLSSSACLLLARKMPRA